jgi:hypothetical protein
MGVKYYLYLTSLFSVYYHIYDKKNKNHIKKSLLYTKKYFVFLRFVIIVL